jgi:DNA-binding NarL/FixJ family response regulator
VSFREALSAVLLSQFPFLKLEKAAGIQEALGKVDSMQPDLIFADVRLPDGDGLGLTRAVRAAGIESVIVILTSHDIPEYRDAAYKSGADHFMTKGSVNITDIFDIIGSILTPTFNVHPRTEGVFA